MITPFQQNRHRNTLKECSLFSGMTDAELGKSLELLHAEAISYARDEFLHFPYRTMDRFGLVLSGAVHVCADDIDGNRVIMAEVAPGTTFGESLCFLRIQDSPVYAYAPKCAEVVWLSVNGLFGDAVGPFTADLQRRFVSMLAMRTLSMNDRIQIMSKVSLREKITAYFDLLSSQKKSREFRIPMNREDFATYIGTNRSALSRELSNMKRDGLIDCEGNNVRIIG